jgi:cell division septation protein DedD
VGSHDTELFKDKIEVSLDGRQIFYLFFGGAVIATLVFVLGVMVGRRVEARAVVETGSAVHDPLAALDRLEAGEGLAFPAALRGNDEVPLGQMDEGLAKRKAAAPKLAVGGPVADGAEAGDEKDGDDQEADAKPEAAEVASDDKVDAKAEAAEAKPKVAEAKPEAEPEDVAVKPEPAKRKRFTLQVGSFQDKVEADAFFRQLEASQHSPYMVAADVPGKGQYFRIRVGAYGSYDDALEAKQQFEDKEHVIAYVTRLK